MNFATVCSGIDAPAVAWKPLGWRQQFCSEIENFPCAVLKHHQPEVPNLGNMLDYEKWTPRPIDVLIGGTPCQSFSVAGLRKGMADPRGNLALTFLGVIERFAPTWVVWENVPGVLSSDEGRCFGAFLGGLAKIGYGFAYTVLDAQWFGLAQRRERVFVVGHIGGQWQRAASVLFDRESLCGNPPPSRAKGQGATYDVAPSIGASGRGFERAGETRVQDCVIPINMQAAIKNGAKSPNMMGIGQDGDPAFTVNASDRHGDAIGFDSKQGGDTQLGATRGLSPPLKCEVCNVVAHAFNACTGGNQIDMTYIPEIEPCSPTRDAKGERQDVQEPSLIAGTITFSGGHSAGSATNQDANSNLLVPVKSPQMKVRRLTPVECLRLQGFPDNYLDITYRGKPACDGPKYRAIGNSMAVPVIGWIGKRIAMVSAQVPIAGD